MSKTFAILDQNGIVVNSIVVDDYVIAQSLLPNSVIIEVTEQTGPAYINGTFESGMFFSQKPFDSWVKDLTNKKWTAPIPEPEIEVGFYTEWNESKENWDILEIPILNEGSSE
jgi:hypothetical protein